MFHALTLMYCDPAERDAIYKEFLSTDDHAQKTLLAKLVKMEPRVRFMFLEEWRSDDMAFDYLAEGDETDSPAKIDLYARRLCALYEVNGLSSPKTTLERCREYVVKYGCERIIRAAEIKKGLPVFGVKWEDQAERRKRFNYSGPYILDDQGFVECVI